MIPVRGGNRWCSAVAGWDADALRDVVRDYALETLADPGTVLVIDGKAAAPINRSWHGWHRHVSLPARLPTGTSPW